MPRESPAAKLTCAVPVELSEREMPLMLAQLSFLLLHAAKHWSPICNSALSSFGPLWQEHVEDGPLTTAAAVQGMYGLGDV